MVLRLGSELKTIFLDNGYTSIDLLKSLVPSDENFKLLNLPSMPDRTMYSMKWKEWTMQKVTICTYSVHNFCFDLLSMIVYVPKYLINIKLRYAVMAGAVNQDRIDAPEQAKSIPTSAVQMRSAHNRMNSLS